MAACQSHNGPQNWYFSMCKCLQKYNGQLLVFIKLPGRTENQGSCFPAKDPTVFSNIHIFNCFLTQNSNLRRLLVWGWGLLFSAEITHHTLVLAGSSLNTSPILL